MHCEPDLIQLIMKRISLFFSFLIPFLAVSQEQIFPATVNTAKLQEKRKTNFYEPKSGDMLSIPFVDDFSSDKFPGNTEGNPVHWENNYATRNTGLPILPPTVGVVSFDGTDEVGYPYSFSSGSGPADTLTSCPIDLEFDSDDGIGLSFFYQPQGNTYFPPSSSSDSLIVEFYAPELDQWYWAWSTIDISSPEEFTFIYIPITQDRYLKPGFQFRFRNIAFLQGLYSVWNVDYVFLGQNNTDPIYSDVAFVEPIHTFLNDYTSIPLSHYAEDPSARMKSEFDVLFRNLNDDNTTLQDNTINIFHEGVLIETIANQNEPPLPASSLFTYNHSLENGNQFFFDPTLSDDELIYDVSIQTGTDAQAETITNNTISFQQSFYTHYSYDDGSAEAGYAVSNSGSRVALRYINLKSDSVWALQIYTMPFGINYENSPFSIKIWEDNGGVPGAEIADASHVVVHSLAEYQASVIYKFDEPVFIPSGSFFVGYQQSSQDEGIRIGLDFGTTGNDGNLFFDDGNGWTPTNLVAEASLMLRPMFTTEGYQIIASVDDRKEIEGLSIFPNPASTEVRIEAVESENLEVQMFDLSGRLVRREIIRGTMNVSDIVPGMYILQITDEEGRRATRKLSVGR